MLPRTESIALALAVAASSAGCGDAAREANGEGCAVRLAPGTALQALVRSVADGFGLSGSQSCAAAVIAPNLVLTAAHCVSRQVAGSFECDASAGWELVEQGGGQGRLGEAFPAAGVSIFQPDERGVPRRAAVARAILTFGARTRCADDLAALILEGALEVEPLPLRFAAVTQVGDVLSLGVFSEDGRERVPRPVSVTQVAQTVSTLEAPVRALRLSGGACGLETGGPVFSPATGALVALPFRTLPASAGCDAGADVLGLQLSAYEDFVRDAAEQAGAELRVEAAQEAAEGDAHCPAPGALAPDAGE